MFFSMLANMYGSFIKSDEVTFAKSRMDVARIYLSTSSVELIRESLEVVIDGKQFYLSVVEEVVLMEEKAKRRGWSEEDDSSSDGSMEDLISIIGVDKPGEKGEGFEDEVVSEYGKESSVMETVEEEIRLKGSEKKDTGDTDTNVSPIKEGGKDEDRIGAINVAVKEAVSSLQRVACKEEINALCVEKRSCVGSSAGGYNGETERSGTRCNTVN